MCQAAVEGLGLQAVWRDLGRELKLRIHSDATAAIGICRRRGLGRVRHLAATDLWIRVRLRTHDFELVKVLGSDNPADLLTKYLDRPLHDKHISALNLMFETGRAESAAQIGEQVVACCLSYFYDPSAHDDLPVSESDLRL